MTTVHASTATQLVVDGPAKGGKDWRGGRYVGELSIFTHSHYSLYGDHI